MRRNPFVSTKIQENEKNCEKKQKKKEILKEEINSPRIKNTNEPKEKPSKLITEMKKKSNKTKNEPKK